MMRRRPEASVQLPPPLEEAPASAGEERGGGGGKPQLSNSAAAPRIPLQGWGPNVADERGGVSGSFPCLNPFLIPVKYLSGTLQGG
jgi:hypothetical protein